MKCLSWIVGLTIALAVAPVVLAPAYAADTSGAANGVADVDLPPILAPMVVKGRLQGYAYLTIGLTPASRDKQLLIRAKVPFLQDAFLRELNQGSIMESADPKKVDTKATKARLLARVGHVLPPGTVSDLKFEKVVLAPLEPQS